MTNTNTLANGITVSADRITVPFLLTLADFKKIVRKFDGYKRVGTSTTFFNDFNAPVSADALATAEVLKPAKTLTVEKIKASAAARNEKRAEKEAAAKAAAKAAAEAAKAAAEAAARPAAEAALAEFRAAYAARAAAYYDPIEALKLAKAAELAKAADPLYDDFAALNKHLCFHFIEKASEHLLSECAAYKELIAGMRATRAEFQALEAKTFQLLSAAGIVSVDGYKLTAPPRSLSWALDAARVR